MTVMVETVVVVIVTGRGGPSGTAVIIMHYCKHRTQTSLTHSPSSRVYVVHWSVEDGPGPTTVYAVSMME